MPHILSKAVKKYPRLQKDYRNVFPFRLATTSYIYPDHILPNASLLAPHLNEIELVLFEAGNLPDTSEIEELCFLHEQHGLSFNIHLPLDISLGSPSQEIRNQGIKAVLEVINLCERLHPSTYTLHYSDDHGTQNSSFSQWQGWIAESTRSILDAGVNPRMISIETLDYPLSRVENIIEDLDLSICLDFGHILLAGENLQDYASKYLERATIVHLHGVCDGRDHKSLALVDAGMLSDWLRLLREYTGVVSIEVFSFEKLEASLSALETIWERI